ncbi:hypothetical protein LTR64_007812 [Lithohypha guttulata]|uniref:uncharacterized protein n=1 Tax=Lithohypha guttulata TaxID=1690604 RepID=UPI002DE16CCD|nr:hypothetical protein LTR51_007324 [Lithohypha guttulata]
MASALEPRQACSSDFRVCAPPGLTTNTLGPISSQWGQLYSDIISTVNGYSIEDGDGPTTTLVDPDGPARREMAFCCSNIADCLIVKNYGIQMCWDRYTTNVFFPDGTYGSVVSADFNTSTGDSVNLVYGEYTLGDGQKGNIYQGEAATSMKPDTATMTRPRSWTSSGEGSAIPATELGTSGEMSTMTTVIAATTEAASTGDSITLIATMTDCQNCPAYNTTIAGLTDPGTTRQASTAVITTAVLNTTGIITPTITGTSKASRLSIELTVVLGAALLGMNAICF